MIKFRVSHLKTFLLITSIFTVGCSDFLGKRRAPRHRDTPVQDENTPKRSDSQPPTSQENHKQASPKSLIFSAIDPSASPWQAAIYQMNLETLSVQRILTGESGDTAFFNGNGNILLFNRSFDSQNFRALTPGNDSSLIAKQQQKFAGGEIGDPHDALYIGKDRILLAHYTAGELVIIDQNSGQEIETVQADWDLPSGSKLKPEALRLSRVGDKQFVYVIHQGMNIADGAISVNGSQQIFVLALNDGKLSPVDLNSTEPRIQGIKIKGSFPVPVRFSNREKILIVSMCSRNISNSSDNDQHKCVASVEEIDPKSNTASEVWDLNNYGIFMNGPVVPGPNVQTFFANVERQTGYATFGKRVLRFSIDDHLITTAYQFRPGSGGFWGTFYDENSKRLFCGDIGANGSGVFAVINDNGEKTEISLERVPYAGIFAAGQ